MGHEPISQREAYLLQITALLLIGVLVFLVVQEWHSWYQSGSLLVLVALFAINMMRLPDDVPPRRMHLYLAIQTALIALSITQGTIFVFLFFILSAQAMMDLPMQAGLRWIALFALITIFANFYTDFNLLSDTINSLINGAGFLFFGTFGSMLRRSEAARAESQRLLKELQEAHRQLQAYAERVEELAASEERNRLSREMHDTLGHRLTVSLVQLEGAERLIQRDSEKARRMIQTVRGQLKEGLDELRRTLAALRNPLLAGTSLPDALQTLVQSFEDATQMRIHLALPATLPPLSDAQKITLYRSAQEALTNVQRHARAQTIWLDLAREDGAIVLTVRDDGVGMTEDEQSSGLGLRGMRERAQQLGGTLTITAPAQGGTALAVRLPLYEPQEQSPHETTERRVHA